MIREYLILFMLLTFTIGFAQNVFVWDRDLENTIMDPEDPWTFVGLEYGIINALNANGITPSVDIYLPDDLTQYDIIFATIGIWCAG